MYGNDTSTRPPQYELFFAPLEIAFDQTTYESVRFAYIASKFGHHRQKRDDGSRYFDHPKGAAWVYINEFGGRDPRIIRGLLLHDLDEDSYLLSPFRINLNFDQDTAWDVRAVTKLPKGKETAELYLKRIIACGKFAITIKLFDRLHNMRTLGSSSKEKQTRQIAETRRHYLPTLIPALRGYGGHWAELANGLEARINEALDEVL